MTIMSQSYTTNTNCKMKAAYALTETTDSHELSRKKNACKVSHTKLADCISTKCLDEGGHLTIDEALSMTRSD